MKKQEIEFKDYFLIMLKLYNENLYCDEKSMETSFFYLRILDWPEAAIMDALHKHALSFKEYMFTNRNNKKDLFSIFYNDICFMIEEYEEYKFKNTKSCA
jgi:hypothetical protein